MNWMYYLIKYVNFLDFKPIYPRSFSNTLTKLVKNKSYSGGGTFSNYYIISASKGIKILRGKFETFEEAINSELFKEASQEVSFTRIARERTGIVPKCYGTRIVHLEDFYRIGIILEHLDGPVGQDCTHYNSQVRTSLRKTLSDAGINHLDLHNENCIWYKEKWWIIDFSPEYIKLTA